MSTANAQVKRSVGRPRLIQRIDPLPKLGILNNPSNDDNLVELSYDNVSIFKKIFNLLKTMNVKEINIQFNNNYTKIFGIDHLEKNLINIKIDSNKLNHYYCEHPINITLEYDDYIIFHTKVRIDHFGQKFIDEDILKLNVIPI